MKFALFFLAEYAHVVTNSALIAVLFLGGWQLVPFGGGLAGHVWWLGWLGWLDESVHPLAALLRLGVMVGKVCGLVFVYMWIRWSLPRFRFDQLMRLAWRGLVPTGLGLVAVAGVLVYVGRAVSWWATVLNVAVVVIVLLGLAVLGGPVTGRQADLPAIRVEAGE
jgi:NADH-quinone oxidoreductase subunit H